MLPESKYVAYLSVLSRISNCQGLGRRNKFEILKTDRRQVVPPELLQLQGHAEGPLQLLLLSNNSDTSNNKHT